MSKPEKPFGSHPAVVILSIIASLLAIFEFVTNLHSLKDFVARPQPDSTSPAVQALRERSATTVATPVAVQPTQRETLLASTTSKVPSDIIYAAGYQGQGVYEIDKGGNGHLTVAHTSLYNNRLLLWNAPHDELYCIADNGAVISVLTFNPLREVSVFNRDVGWNSLSAALTQTGDRLYVATAQGGHNSFRQVVVFDTATRDEVDKIRLDERQGELYLALSPDGKNLYLSWDDKLDIYDARTLRLVKREQFATWQSGRLAVSSDGSVLHICQDNVLIALGSATLERVKSIEIPGLDRDCSATIRPAA